MHEFSLVRGLLSQVLQAAAPTAAGSIKAVYVSLGPLSGVEPLLLSQAFDQLKCSYGMELSEFVLEMTPLLAKCRECQSEFEVRDFVFRCDKCGASSVRITQGEEFRLLRIIVEDAPIGGQCASTPQTPIVRH